MRDATALGDLSEQFRGFATAVRRSGAVRYARICEGAAADEALLELVAGAPPDQRRPNILLAAVHFLLLSGVDDPLATCYPTVLAWRGIDPPAVGAPEARDPFPPFATFCAHHRSEIAHLVATRATQTNEVGRCAAIFPALSAVASRAKAPIAIVDLGASAGLNLLFDRYAYRYDYGDGGGDLADGEGDRASGDGDRDGGDRADGDGGHPGHAGGHPGHAGGHPGHAGGTHRGGAVGDPGSPVLLHCEVRNGGAQGSRPPTAMPAVAARVGIDRRPVDVHDEDQVLWLLACQWPDHLDRFDTARRALSLARTIPDAPVVRRGDAIEDLASTVASLPADAHVCVQHSWVAAYFTPQEQRALADAVAGVASTRPVSWLFAEAPYEVPGLPVPPPPGERVRGATAVVLVEQGPGAGRTSRRLADMHAHGRWLHWYGAGD